MATQHVAKMYKNDGVTRRWRDPNPKEMVLNEELT
jgi:hypothetical protein